MDYDCLQQQKSAIIKIIVIRAKSHMTTPLKLKRNQDAFTRSTVDRTMYPGCKAMRSFGSIVPSFCRQDLPLSKRSGLKQETTISITVCQYESTRTLQHRIGEIIQNDDQLSQRNTYRSYRGHFYNEKHSKQRIAKGTRFQFPAKVYQIYGEYSRSSEGPVNFTHGCLETCGIYYFSIQNTVLFYDITAVVHSSRKIADCFLHQMIFEATVFELKQIEWKNPLIKQFHNKRLIAVLQPWCLSLMMIQIQSFSQKAVNDQIRWIRASNLNFCLNVDSKKMQHLVVSRQNMFYLNQRGTIHHISYQPTNWVRKALTGRDYRLINNSRRIGISTNHFYVSRKIGILQKIKHYGKIISTQVKNLFGGQSKNIGLCFDQKTNLLFCLVDTSPKDESTLSYSKILSCWSLNDGKLTQKCRISELQFYCSQLQQILPQGDSANCRIAKIFCVQRSFYPQSNLLVVLECGLRLYLKVTNRFQIVSYNHINSLQNPRKSISKHNPRQSDFFKPLSLVHCMCQGSLMLMTLKDANQLTTYSIWKKNEERQEEYLSKIVWEGSIKDEQDLRTPTQSQLFKCVCSSQQTKKWKMISAQLQPSQFTSRHDIFLHQLARDMYILPETYIHSTESYLQYFFIMRPVDILLATLSAEVSEQSIIRKIMPQYSRKELMFMLVQLMCDGEGLYVKDVDFVQIVATYASNQTKYSQQNNLFADFIKEYQYKLIDPYLSKTERLQSSSASLHTRSFINNIENTMVQLLFKFSQKQQQTNKLSHSTTQSIHQNIFASILVYTARLLRFIWRKKLSSITKQTFYLIQEIQSVKYLIDRVIGFEYRSSDSFSSAKDTKYKLKRVTAKEDLSLDSKSTQNQKQTIRAKSLRQFMDKVQQLLLMIARIDIPIAQTFESAIGMEPTQYEEYIFEYLVSSSSNPIKILQNFKQIFPLFIGKNLQKSLKIYRETQQFNAERTLETLRFHKNVPKYLLNSIKLNKHLRNSELLQFDQQISNSKINLPLSSTPRQNIQTLLATLNEQSVPLFQRSAIIYTLKTQLSSYLDSKKGCEDVFYITAKRDIGQKQKHVIMQELILQAYKQKQGSLRDLLVLQQLQRTLLPLQQIQDSIKLLNQNVYIVYLYMFKDATNSSVRMQLIAQYLKVIQTQYRQTSAKTSLNWRDRLNFWKLSNRIERWTNLQHTLNFVMTNCKKYISTAIFIDNVVDSLLDQRIVNNYLFGSDSFEEALSLLDVSEIQKDASLSFWRQKLKFPILSFNFLQCGLDQQHELKQYYSFWLGQMTEAATNFTIVKSNKVIYNWLCYFCLLICSHSSLDIFSKRSQDLLMKLKQQKTIKQQTANKMRCLISANCRVGSAI